MRTMTLLAMMLFSLNAAAQTGTAIGKWKTIDDETGQPKSIVEIYKDGDELKGRVATVLSAPEHNPVCKQCQGDKKDKPIQGLEIMWGLRETKAGEEWGGGQILDPKNGKTYKAKIRLQDGGEKLEVRGFIGMSFLGRSQTWIREK